MDYRKTDPDFMERAEHFAFEEVVNEPGQELDAPTRWLAILAALVGCQGQDAFREFLPKALDEGLSPVWVKEMVYQSADYVGLGRMWPFLSAVNEALEARGVALPACGAATTTMENRLEKGAQAQADIFGPPDAGGLEERFHKPLAGGQLLRGLLHPHRAGPEAAGDDHLLLPHGPGGL